MTATLLNPRFDHLLHLTDVAAPSSMPLSPHPGPSTATAPTTWPAWRVPDGDRVRYDRNEQDLVAADQLRSAHGKGVRAILHSAVTIGMAQHCFDNDRPHSGFVVLDSPLVTYRPPKAGETSNTKFSMSLHVLLRVSALLNRSGASRRGLKAM